MDVIVFSRAEDGGVGIIVPTGEVPISQVLQKDLPPNAINPRIIDRSTIPSDRSFRDAWKDDGGKVDVDMSKARDIHMGRIRVARDKALEALDKDFTKALGQKKQKDADDVEAKRQALRDLPLTFDLTRATTPAELKALWPPELPKP